MSRHFWCLTMSYQCSFGHRLYRINAVKKDLSIQVSNLSWRLFCTCPLTYIRLDAMLCGFFRLTRLPAISTFWRYVDSRGDQSGKFTFKDDERMWKTWPVFNPQKRIWWTAVSLQLFLFFQPKTSTAFLWAMIAPLNASAKISEPNLTGEVISHCKCPHNISCGISLIRYQIYLWRLLIICRSPACRPARLPYLSGCSHI